MDARVRKALDILERTNFKPIPLADLAALVGLGPSRLEHIFKRELHASIREHRLQQRMQRAAELIASTDERISVIAWSLSFTDAANFSHAFKARYGVSPRRYRETARTNR